MDRLTARKVRYYVGLHYPLHVTLGDTGFQGTYPDLPGCTAMAADPTDLYAVLEQVRRDWIAARVFAGEEVPMPNAHLKLTAVAAPRPAKSVELEVVQTTWAVSTRFQASA